MIEEFYKSMRFALKDLTIFPGSNLKDILKFAIIIAVISTLAFFFTPIAFLHPIGAWLGVGVLAIAYFIGGVKDSAIVNSDGASNDDGRVSEVQQAGASDER